MALTPGGRKGAASPSTKSDHHADFASTVTANSMREDEKPTVEDSLSDDPAPQINHEIEALARRLTRASTAAADELHAFAPQPGSRLDPNSPNFDARAWVKAYIRLAESEDGAAPPRSLGVAFKKLHVFGWTSGAEHQKSYVDYPLDLVSSVVGLFGGRNRKKRVDILRNFEGVVEQGELLLVLGPPGSGCSTLLKTISGETAGLEVDSGSYMNFRGESPSQPQAMNFH